MNRLIACASMAACLALPAISHAYDRDDGDDHRHWRDRGSRDDGYREDGYRDGRDRDDRHRHGHVPGPVRFIGEVIALPFEVGAAVLGGVATVITAPLRFHDHDRREQASYGPPREYDDRGDRREYYGPPPQAYGPPRDGYYYPPPGYDDR